MARASEPPTASREVRELAFLFEVSQTLSRSLDLREVVDPLLDSLAKHLGMVRGTIALLNRQTSQITIEAAHGLSPAQRERGRYSLGEGVTGRVVQSGKPAVIPRIADEPDFLDRTGARTSLEKADTSFICVPIKLGNEVIGALSADRPFPGEAELRNDLRLLAIVASMIAQAVKLRQAAEEERQRLLDENARLQHELKERFRPANIIGNSKAMQDLYDLIAQVAPSNATVLLRGESGTGKELVAHAIHYNSPRADKPFIRVHCGALPESVIESELFGHERGAFTGAIAQRKGRFELANTGSIFLDEIGDISPSTQVKLLRVLQEREFERVGGTDPIRVDVRLIAATNRNLEDLIASGKFREDLYYRLNVFPIHVPPLRERKTDILLLADHFVERYSRANHKAVTRIATPAIDMLVAYHWPGNVRELENCIERAVLLAEGDVIQAHHLPPSLQMPVPSRIAGKGTLDATLAAIERDMLVDALKAARGNQAKAARALGLTERLMGLRIKKHALDARRFRT